MSQIYEILSSLGYRLKDIGSGRFHTSAVFRGGDNQTAILVNPNGSFVDFVDGSNSGSFKKLIALTLGKSYKEVDKYLKNKKYEEVSNEREEVDLSNTYPSVFDIDHFGKIEQIHDYWLKRGVPENIIKHFRGGVISPPSRLAYKYTFPIFARDGRTINGFAARKLDDNRKGPKWACHGKKSVWEYPLFLTEKYIRQTSEIIIAESIGDGLNLSKAGIKNFVLPIGIASFQKLALLCIEFDPKRIIIAFNNDEKTQAGNKAADNLRKTLLNFFHEDKVKVCLPDKELNDFGKMSTDQILNWKNNICFK